ncbi:cytochrome P450 [Pseudovirgaria hyperparasitica]|uniref:Cytochrome P450 n=1 Tax=Pseudovirgaria hyperparasitica TaxID=470096 RepID=A0A6A6WJ83_9PEZI|nr:cytochrome P450 [Pseudovirgaria hyperparasitica]KAF2761351.1 cytochrome P450 [Pseudovirgaria hyperparasitica]
MLFQHKNLLVIIAVALAAAYIYQKVALYFRRRAFKKEHGCEPSYSRYQFKDPIFGLDLILTNIRAAKSRTYLETSYNRFQKYGTTFTSKMVTKPLIVTIEPENVKTVLSTRFKDFGLGERLLPFAPLLGKGIFTMDGDHWAHSRHMIRPNFARDQVADLQMLESHVQELLKSIPRDGTTIDLQDLFFRTTIDSATEFLFGESVDSQRQCRDQPALHGAADPSSSFADAFNYAQRACATRSRLGALRVFYSDSKDTASTRICHAFVQKYVNDALLYRKHLDLDPEKAAPPSDAKYVFLHELAKSTTDPVRLRDELLNVLLAGRDTTASLLSNLFFVLARRPDIWAKLRAEVAQLGGAPPSYEQLRNMKYLKYCMNESLRLHPVVPNNGRVAKVDTVLPLGGGPTGTSPLFVPKGTQVIYSPYAMHRRQDYYGADALEFRPERWASLRPGWEYLPFNGGPRICLGQQYALTEAGYVTVRLAQGFGGVEARGEEGRGWVEGLSLTLACGDGVRVGLRVEEGEGEGEGV